MVLLVLWRWLKPEIEGHLRAQGDAAGALQSSSNRRSKSGKLSGIVREVTLHFANEPSVVPPELRPGIPRCIVVVWRLLPVITS